MRPTIIGRSYFSCNALPSWKQGIPGLDASEASLTTNPGGEFLYGAWSELDHGTGESDAMARRVWWIDDYIGSNAWILGQSPGEGQLNLNP